MAAVATAGRGDRLEPRRLAAVTPIVDQRPCTVERGRAEIIIVPAHGVAGGIADAAIDAFDPGVGGQGGGLAGQELNDRIDTCFIGLEL